MTPDAVLATVTAELEQTASRWAQRWPEQAGRIVKGLGYAKGGQVTRGDDEGTVWVKGYEVTPGRCECDDHKYRSGLGIRCSHRFAAALAHVVGLLEPESREEQAEVEQVAWIGWALAA
jgi:hypothetical protein